MFKKILIPLDGSNRAENALKPAILVAENSQSELILMRVPDEAQTVTPIPSVEDYNWMQDSIVPVEEEVQAYLSFVQNTISRPHVCVRTKVVEGDRAGAIVDTAVSENIDLICMSTHGRSGFSRLMLGSVAERVLSNAPCPVLTLHAAADPIKHILIALDGSPLAEQALKPSLTLAKACGSQVTLLRVQDKVDITIAEAETYLQSCIAAQQMAGVMIETAVVSGPIASKILEFATNNQVDLIAMTTHGRTGLRRWLYGSTTAKVLHGNPSAMLIIRPDVGGLM